MLFGFFKVQYLFSLLRNSSSSDVLQCLLEGIIYYQQKQLFAGPPIASGKGLPQILKQNQIEQHSRCCCLLITGSTDLILLLTLFSFQCDYSDSPVSFYITVVENKIRPPVFADEIMIPEYSFLALLVSPQLPIFQLFRNSHCCSMCVPVHSLLLLYNRGTGPHQNPLCSCICSRSC